MCCYFIKLSLWTVMGVAFCSTNRKKRHWGANRGFFFFFTACVSRLFSVQQSQSPQHSSHRKDVGEVFCGQGFKSLPQGTDYVLQLFLCWKFKKCSITIYSLLSGGNCILFFFLCVISSFVGSTLFEIKCSEAKSVHLYLFDMTSLTWALTEYLHVRI